VLTDPDLLRTFSTDAARFCPAGTAAALVRVRSTVEVSTVLRLATQHRVPVVPQGARTGLAGGANAVDGCLLLNLERMNHILAIDPGEQIAVVQPGVVNARCPPQSPGRACSTRRIRRHGTARPSGATSRPTRAACAV
jgi:glycolate oxidase